MGIKVKSHAGYIVFNEWNLDSMDKIYDLFQAVRTGEASAALDPIEQSIQESLNDAV